jgi:hypothetical protein
MTESERLHGINFVYFTRIRIMMSLRLLLCACQPLITFVQTGGFYVKLQGFSTLLLFISCVNNNDYHTNV